MEIIELITTTIVIINLLYSREEKYAFLFLINVGIFSNILKIYVFMQGPSSWKFDQRFYNPRKIEKETMSWIISSKSFLNQDL